MSPGRPPKEPVGVTCRWCGAVLWLCPSNAARRRYCSRECYRQAMAVAYRTGQLGIHPQRRGAPHPYRSLQSRARALGQLRNGPAAARATWSDAELRWHTCTACGEEFPSRARRSPRFCSRRCWARAHYQSRAYSVPAICPVCGQAFLTGRYRRFRTCSRACGQRLRQHGARGQ